MEEQLSLEFLRVVENGAIAAARTMGFGDRHKADEVAVEAMRKTMDAVQMDGTIVIGEGERDEAPMLYIGEKVGLATHAPKALFPEVDIAVDRSKARIFARPAHPDPRRLCMPGRPQFFPCTSRARATSHPSRWRRAQQSNWARR